MSSENPYQSPLEYTPAVGVKSGRREDVRSVAICQKGILVCILANLIVMVGLFALPPALRPLARWGFVAVAVVGVAFVFLLSIKVYNVVIGILLGLMSLIPWVGLLVLLAVNGKATTILRKNGHRVGLMGVKLSEM